MESEEVASLANCVVPVRLIEEISVNFVRSWRMAASALVLTTGAFSSPALANKILADTPFLLIGSEEPLGPMIARKGDVIVSSRLVYALLAVADADFVGTDGKLGAEEQVLLKKGEQMFGLIAQNGQITYCSIKNKEVGALNGFIVNNLDKHTCFIDDDRNGTFDRSFDLRTKFTNNIPIYYDTETTGNPLSRPASYSSIDPAECELEMALEVYLLKLSREGARATVGFRMTSEKGDDYLDQRMMVDMDAATNLLEFEGARLSFEKLDRAQVRISIGSGIAQRPFLTGRRDVY